MNGDWLQLHEISDAEKDVGMDVGTRKWVIAIGRYIFRINFKPGKKLIEYHNEVIFQGWEPLQVGLFSDESIYRL